MIWCLCQLALSAAYSWFRPRHSETVETVHYTIKVQSTLHTRVCQVARGPSARGSECQVAFLVFTARNLERKHVRGTLLLLVSGFYGASVGYSHKLIPNIYVVLVQVRQNDRRDLQTPIERGIAEDAMSMWVFRSESNVNRPADNYEQYIPRQETSAFLLFFENDAGDFELNVKATAASSLSSPIGGG